MKNFTVRFYYYTDLRYEWKGQAHNEVNALVLAVAGLKASFPWCVSSGFGIEIKVD